MKGMCTALLTHACRIVRSISKCVAISAYTQRVPSIRYANVAQLHYPTLKVLDSRTVDTQAGAVTNFHYWEVENREQQKQEW